jgi:hypothetical protein
LQFLIAPIKTIGKHWEKKVAGNVVSFEEVYHGNADVCPRTIEVVASSSHKKIWRQLNSNQFEVLKSEE